MIPLTVLGGYLGAGKTTLVNSLLRAAQGRRIAVLVNDFGELPVDADLIEADDGDILALTGGCVCCSYGDDLTAALDTVRGLAPDAILLEASGVALPGAIAATATLIPDLSVGGVVVVADAETIRAQAQDRWMRDTVLRQLAAADIVLLTKTDLAPDLAAVHAWLAETVPGTPVLEAPHGRVAPELVLDLPRAPGATEPAPGHLHGLATELLHPAPPVDAVALARSLAADPAILRAKGHVQTGSGPRLVQVVGGRGETAPSVPGARLGLVVIRRPAP